MVHSNASERRVMLAFDKRLKTHCMIVKAQTFSRTSDFAKWSLTVPPYAAKPAALRAIATVHKTESANSQFGRERES